VEEPSSSGTPARHTVRLPRFIASEPAGLGDTVKRMTAAAGVRPCSGCEQRAQRLNRWLRFEPGATEGDRGARP
jgi:hypothetical protein